MMTMNEIIELTAKEVFKKNSLASEILQIKYTPSRINAGFSHEEGIVNVYPENIKLSAEHVNEDYKDYTVLVVCHELGHFFDSNTSKFKPYLDLLNDVYQHPYLRYTNIENPNRELILMLEGKIDQFEPLEIEIESAAWEIGKKFVPTNLRDKFDDFNQTNLNSYARRRNHWREVLKGMKVSE